MLGIRSAPLQAVDDDPEVVEQKAAFDEAIAECARLEADEFRMKRALNPLHNVSDEAVEEARNRLKPPHPRVTIASYFVLPEAEQARKNVGKLRAAYAASRQEAMHHLHAQALDLLTPLFKKLDEAIDRALTLRQEVEEMRHLLMDKGAEEGMLPPVPSCLIDEGLLIAQWRSAKATLEARRDEMEQSF